MSNQPTDPNASPSSNDSSQEVEHIVVREYPDVVYLWPTFLMSFLFFIIGSFDVQQSTHELLGVTFLTVLAFNLLVLSFEFGRVIVLALVSSLLALIFFTLWMGDSLPFIQWIQNYFLNLEIWVSPSFYGGITIVFAVLFLLVFLRTRFNYWVMDHNEFVHKHGILGDVDRYSTEGIRVNKEIDDIFEFLLLLSGKLVIKIPGESRDIVLRNVPRINHVENKLKDILSRTQVEVSSGPR